MAISNSGSVGRGKAFDIFIQKDFLNKTPKPDIFVASPNNDLCPNCGKTEQISSSFRNQIGNKLVDRIH